MKINYAITISFLLIIFAIYYSFTSLLPSKISNLNTPKTEFSTERALVQLKEITKKPHYVGTEEHTKVRNYIVAELENIGLKVEIQEQMALNKKWRGAVKAKNIIARIKGSQPGKSLVLLTHYDSAVHSSYGASDAGSGVVAILEGVRAFLETGKKPKNDIIILITDAEEIGLLGAVAFVNHHPWAKNVGLILNLEARGSGGPSYMLLETNGGNKELINAFNKAKANYPVANSLMYSIYKMLPNDTDLTPLREEGNLNGINFAFIDDHFDYHTAQDTYENLDRNTLEQQGDYLMTMLNYFSDANLESLNSKKDNVYFNFPFLGLVTYPFSWIIAMFILGALLFLGITYYGVQKQKLTTPAMFAGFVPFLGSIIVSVLVAVFGWKLIKIIHPQYNDILHGFTYNGYLYIIAFVSITLAITFYFYKRYFIKHSAANLIVAPIFIWGIINLLIVIYLKGAAFFILPVYAALATLAMLLYSKRNKQFKIIVSTLLAIPTLIVFAPLVKMFPVGLGLKMLGISALFVVLIFGLMLPTIKKWKNSRKLSYLFLGIGFIALISASFKSDYTINRKQPVSLNYVLDATNNKAYFTSYNKKVNDYNKEYLTENPTKGSIEKTASDSKYKTRINLHKQTNVVALEQANIQTIVDTIIGDNRLLKLQIIPQRKTNRMEFIAKNNIHFKSFIVNGEELKSKSMYVFDTEKSKNILSYYFTEKEEVLNIEFSIPKTEKPEILIYDVAYDLFTNDLLNVKPRTDESTFSTPFVVNDATIIKTIIKF